MAAPIGLPPGEVSIHDSTDSFILRHITAYVGDLHRFPLMYVRPPRPHMNNIHHCHHEAEELHMLTNSSSIVTKTLIRARKLERNGGICARAGTSKIQRWSTLGFAPAKSVRVMALSSSAQALCAIAVVSVWKMLSVIWRPLMHLGWLDRSLRILAESTADACCNDVAVINAIVWGRTRSGYCTTHLLWSTC